MGAPARASQLSHAARRPAAGADVARLSLKLHAFRAANGGATAIEYAMIAGIVSIAIVAGATSIGMTLSSTFEAVVAGFP
ncbi:MAG: Flp family type IVb pilin [Alphaproteobacteria bacterium]|nr:Flp family type IVb pilin [Alphaproteobacteria bacterium]